MIHFIIGTVNDQEPHSHLEQLKEELGNNNMLFPKTCLQLTRVIGQGV